MQGQFSLVGDDVAMAKTLEIDSRWKLEDLQRAVGALFHVAKPTGTAHIQIQALCVCVCVCVCV